MLRSGFVVIIVVSTRNLSRPRPLSTPAARKRLPMSAKSGGDAAADAAADAGALQLTATKLKIPQSGTWPDSEGTRTLFERTSSGNFTPVCSQTPGADSAPSPSNVFERTSSGNFKPLYDQNQMSPAPSSSRLSTASTVETTESSPRLAALLGARMHWSTATSTPLSPSKLSRSRPSLLPAAPGSGGVLLDFTRASSLSGLMRTSSLPDLNAGTWVQDIDVTFTRVGSLDAATDAVPSDTDAQEAAATFEDLQSLSSAELWAADSDIPVHGHAPKATRSGLKVSFRKMLLKKLGVGSGRNSTF